MCLSSIVCARTESSPDSGADQCTSAPKGGSLVLWWAGSDLEPDDIRNAVLFPAFDEGRDVAGAALPVDAGLAAK
jgi:hypothetical protein